MIIGNIQYKEKLGQNAWKNYNVRQLTSFEKVTYLQYNICERY